MHEKLLNILVLIISVLVTALVASWVYFGVGGGQVVNSESLRLEQQSFLVLLFGVLTALFAVIFFIAVSRGDAPVVETHWGGIGGSLGGWRLSKSLVYFLGALAFGAMAVVSLDRPDQSQSGSAARTEASTQATTAE